jgi:CRISPR-associated protein Csx1
MNSTLILVAPWGDPFTWSKATYIVEGRRVESTSSLAAVARAERGGTGSKAIIYVQETILAADQAKGSPNNCEPVRRPYRLIHQSNDYKELLDELKETVTGYAREVLHEAGASMASVEAVVAPGVGEFTYLDESCGRRRARWILPFDPGRVNMFTYYEAALMLHLASELLDPSLKGPIRLVVDLTHGVNYTVAAAYRASLYAARLRAAAYHEPVEVVLYNSEPYKPGVEMTLWKVREETIHPKAAASRLVYSIAAYAQGKLVAPEKLAFMAREARDILTTEEMQKLALSLKGALQAVAEKTCNEWEEALKQGVTAAASIAYGAPLLLLEAGGRVLEACGPERLGRLVTSLSRALQESLEEHGRTLVGEGDGEVRVFHVAALARDNIKAFLAQAALALYAAKAYETGEARGVTRLSATGRIAATLQALKVVTEEYLAGPTYLTAVHELSQLERSVKPSKPGEKPPEKAELYRRFSSLSRECKEGAIAGPERGIARCSEVQSRVFAAHAGLNSNIVDVVCVNTKDGLALALSYTSRFLECLSEGWASDMLVSLSRSLGLRAPQGG